VAAILRQQPGNFGPMLWNSRIHWFPAMFDILNGNLSDDSKAMSSAYANAPSGVMPDNHPMELCLLNAILKPLMILVAGPYRSGTNDDPVLIARNVEAMTEAALLLFRAGHLPVMGEWYAMPLLEHAGSKAIGDDIFNEIFHPVALRLVPRCDACLRIGGASSGADEMVALARQHGKTVYFSLAEVPAAA